MRALKESVPGLVQAQAEGAVQISLSAFAASDRLVSAGQHHLLIKPDAFHVSVLFQPTLAFLGRVVEILPVGAAESARDTSATLDEFVLSVYLPQLQDRVSALFISTVTGVSGRRVRARVPRNANAAQRRTRSCPTRPPGSSPRSR